MTELIKPSGNNNTAYKHSDNIQQASATEFVDYTTLACSLPVLPKLLEAKSTPISRIQLNKRLRMLSSADGALLNEIENLLLWEHLTDDRSDRQLVMHAAQLLTKITDKTLYEALIWRMDMRSLVAALRHRQQGKEPGQLGKYWCYSRFEENILRHWQHPHFQLQARFPWLVAVETALAEERPLQVEKILLSTTWQQLNNLTQGHQFDFISVVLYVLRWDIVARWTSYNHDTALQHFDELLNEGLGEYKVLFASVSY